MKDGRCCDRSNRWCFDLAAAWLESSTILHLRTSNDSPKQSNSIGTNCARPSQEGPSQLTWAKLRGSSASSLIIALSRRNDCQPLMRVPARSLHDPTGARVDPETHPTSSNPTQTMHRRRRWRGSIDRCRDLGRPADHRHHPWRRSTRVSACVGGEQEHLPRRTRMPPLHTTRTPCLTRLEPESPSTRLTITEKDSDAGVSASGGAPKSFARRDHLRYVRVLVCRHASTSNRRPNGSIEIEIGRSS